MPVSATRAANTSRRSSSADSTSRERLRRQLGALRGLASRIAARGFAELSPSAVSRAAVREHDLELASLRGNGIVDRVTALDEHSVHEVRELAEAGVGVVREVLIDRRPDALPVVELEAWLFLS